MVPLLNYNGTNMSRQMLGDNDEQEAAEFFLSERYQRRKRRQGLALALLKPRLPPLTEAPAVVPDLFCVFVFFSLL